MEVGTEAGDRDLKEVRRIVFSIVDPASARVFLFGSRVSGTARRTSDIDVAIRPRRPLSVGTLSHLREASEESHVPYTVDVVDPSQVDETFRTKVLRDGTPWNASRET